jgi:hypothetical protein
MILKYNGEIAQLVEHRTHKPRVEGSSPSLVIKIIKLIINLIKVKGEFYEKWNNSKIKDK